MTLTFADDGELAAAQGPYRVDDKTLYEEFVEQAPHFEVRQRLHTAMRLHLDILRSIGGPGRVIIGGGFVSRKPTPPRDVDLVYLCRDSDHLESIVLHPDALPLLTLQSGYFAHPVLMGFKRLQPVGGKVDAFLAAPKRYNYWRGLWSTVKGTGKNGIPRVERGYLEVEI